ncbi:hypothetical protein Vadar_003713 [Vaccinium darrowii]|uniref:Uncharacterized protein n=1 Tax=Vaccinium darrowii TaxID=229202 RepID=A0ACB7XFM6_9ERIC|nr:hypothetical protein Vadar_003713 [Vaccinium darrowii]
MPEVHEVLFEEDNVDRGMGEDKVYYNCDTDDSDLDIDIPLTDDSDYDDILFDKYTEKEDLTDQENCGNNDLFDSDNEMEDQANIDEVYVEGMRCDYESEELITGESESETENEDNQSNDTLKISKFEVFKPIDKAENLRFTIGMLFSSLEQLKTAITEYDVHGRYEVERSTVQKSPTFKRLYICFDACKKGFAACRPVIGIDGCHLKGLYGGILLAAVGRDPNEEYFPLAFAVVEAENKDSWMWFISLLLDDVGSDRTYTFTSDQQKNAEDYTSEYYTVETYKRAYAPLIYPTNGSNLWEATGHPPLLPPPLRRPTGRPKKNLERENQMNPRKVQNLEGVAPLWCVRDVEGQATIREHVTDWLEARKTCLGNLQVNKDRGGIRVGTRGGRRGGLRGGHTVSQRVGHTAPCNELSSHPPTSVAQAQCSIPTSSSTPTSPSINKSTKGKPLPQP